VSQGNVLRISRRFFFEKGIASIVSLGAIGYTLSSCSTFDDYLIEDQLDFDQDVVIVGSGLPALFAAYELKKNKIPFKLFGPDSRFGAQFLSMGNKEWGYFKFEKKDVVMLALVKELNLDIEWLNSQQWTVKGGVSLVINELVDLVQGIIPKRQLRLNHKLVQIQKFGPRYQLVFQSADREKTFYAKKVILALEPQQIAEVKNLALISSQTEQLVSSLSHLNGYSYMRIALPAERLKKNDRKKSIKRQESIQAEIKNGLLSLSSGLFGEVDVIERHGVYLVTLVVDINHPVRILNNLEKIITLRFEGSLGPEEVLDWGPIVFRPTGKVPVGFGFEINPVKSPRPLPTQSFLQVVSTGLVDFDTDTSHVEQVLNLTRRSLSVYKADI